MRIGIYDPYLDDVGGGEKYMLSIAEYLSKNNNVDVFWDNISDLKQCALRFSLDLSKINTAKNIFNPNFSPFERLLNSRKYDVIIILSDGSIPILFSKKLFLHIQRPLDHVRLNPITKIKLKRVSKIFCNSQFTKTFIDKTFQLSSEVIYPPVELHPKESKKENIILHVGRFRVFDRTVGVSDFKKQHVMIEIFKKMINRGLRDWKFILAVSVHEKDMKHFEKMKSNAKGYPIFFEVNKTNSMLWEFYSKAKIYWHASGFGEDLLSHPEYAEHFGISTVEAMSAGAVPVVFDAGGQREIVENNKNGLLWNTEAEIIMQTNAIIKDEHMWESLSKSAVKSAKKFSKEEFYRRIDTLLEHE